MWTISDFFCRVGFPEWSRRRPREVGWFGWCTIWTEPWDKIFYQIFWTSQFNHHIKIIRRKEVAYARFPNGVAIFVREINFLWIRVYHNRLNYTKNQSIPICNRNKCITVRDMKRTFFWKVDVDPCWAFPTHSYSQFALNNNKQCNHDIYESVISTLAYINHHV